MTRVSAVELVEWQIVEGIEPFGQRREDWRAAITTARLAQAWGVKGITPSDILKDLIDVFEQPAATPADSDAAREARMESAAMAWAGKLKTSNAK